MNIIIKVMVVLSSGLVYMVLLIIVGLLIIMHHNVVVEYSYKIVLMVTVQIPVSAHVTSSVMRQV